MFNTWQYNTFRLVLHTRFILGNPFNTVIFISLFPKRYNFKMIFMHDNNDLHPCFMFFFFYVSVLLMNSTHISSFGDKINAVGIGVSDLGVLLHLRISNSDKTWTMQALFCARPKRMPETSKKINIQQQNFSDIWQTWNSIMWCIYGGSFTETCRTCGGGEGRCIQNVS